MKKIILLIIAIISINIFSGCFQQQDIYPYDDSTTLTTENVYNYISIQIKVRAIGNNNKTLLTYAIANKTKEKYFFTDTSIKIKIQYKLNGININDTITLNIFKDGSGYYISEKEEEISINSIDDLTMEITEISGNALYTVYNALDSIQEGMENRYENINGFTKEQHKDAQNR